MKCLAVYRAERFSPNSVERDKAIMDAVCKLLSTHYDIYKVKEEDIEADGNVVAGEYQLVMTMARSRSALTALIQEQKCGTRIINSPEALLNLSRSRIDRLMRENAIPCAPLHSNGGWWIKRGDEAAQDKADVRFARNDSEKNRIIEEFHQRGITDIVTTAHVDGDLVKFYGVADTEFFHVTYPADSGFSKFGDEEVNGLPQHIPFSRESLHESAAKLAALSGIDIYGGDCIVRADGSFAVIDFNDWPSFAACRRQAAEAIRQRAEK